MSKQSKDGLAKVGLIGLLALALILGTAKTGFAESLPFEGPIPSEGPIRIHVYPHEDTGAVGGIVYQDWDQDGQYDEHEPTLAGATVKLYDAEGREVDRQETERDGRYCFGGLEPGKYVLVEIDPLGYSTLGANEFVLHLRAGEMIEADFGDVLLLCGEPAADPATPRIAFRALLPTIR